MNLPARKGREATSGKRQLVQYYDAIMDGLLYIWEKAVALVQLKGRFTAESRRSWCWRIRCGFQGRYPRVP